MVSILIETKTKNKSLVDNLIKIWSVIFKSPCIVGNLWDVTDRDIDKLTEEFLQSWINEHESNNNETSSTTTSSSSDNSNPSMPSVSSSTTTTTSTSLNPSNICNHLIRARKACKLAYLNGSAPIVYGLPVKFKNSNKNEWRKSTTTTTTTMTWLFERCQLIRIYIIIIIFNKFFLIFYFISIKEFSSSYSNSHSRELSFFIFFFSPL